MRRDSGLILLAAFAAVVVAFIGSTLLSQRAAREVGQLALNISRDAAPGVESMAALRAELRRIQALVEQQAMEVGAGARTPTTGVDEARRRVDESLARFAALPPAPEETRLLRDLQAAVRSFDEAAERVLEQSRSGAADAAMRTLSREVHPLADEAATIAGRLIDFNAQQAQKTAEEIEVVHARAGRLALWMDAMSAILAAIAAFLAVRAVRQVHRVQQEHQEVLQRRNEELEQFAGRVAHDILSPLTSAGLALSLAENARTPQDHIQAAAQRGSASLQRVRRIVDALLEFARSGARPETGLSADVPQVMAGLLEELHPQAQEAAAELRAETIPDSSVACSPGVLHVLVANLVRNALKYLDDSAKRIVVVRAWPRRGNVLFEVEDSGPGLPPELGDRVFQPYVRGRRNSAGKPGIGLGLATVKRLVEAHGGSVGTGRSSLGGALFWFELPAAPKAGPEAVPEAPRRAADRSDDRFVTGA